MKVLHSLTIILFAFSTQATEYKLAPADKASFKNQLERVLKSSVAHDYALKKLKADIEIEDSRLTNRRAELLPEASYIGAIQDDDDYFSHQLRLDWSLFDGFSDIYNGKIKKLDVQIRTKDFEIQKRQVEFSTARRYLDLVEASHQLEIQTQELSLRKKALIALRRRFKRGLTPEDEVLKMRVDLYNAEIRLKNTDTRIKNILEDFKNVAGIEINRSELRHFPLLNSPATIDLQSAYKNTPEYERRQLQSERTDLNVSQNRWQIFSPSLDGFYSYNNNSGSGVNGAPYRFDSSAGLTLTLPLFENLEDYSGFRVAKLNHIKAQHDISNTSRDLKNDLDKLLNDQKNLKKTLQIQIENEKLAQKFYKQSLKRFRLGLIKTNDMAFDLQRLTQVQLQLSTIKRDVYENLIEINLKSGQPILTGL